MLYINRIRVKFNSMSGKTIYSKHVAVFSSEQYVRNNMHILCAF